MFKKKPERAFKNVKKMKKALNYSLSKHSNSLTAGVLSKKSVSNVN